MAGSRCQPPDSNGYLTNIQCAGLEAQFSECSHNINTECNRVCADERVNTAAVQCQSGMHISSEFHLLFTLTFSVANCVNGEMRLVGGSTDREGRVEVCMDGRWGTVCNNNQEIAGAVCSQLGFSSMF